MSTQDDKKDVQGRSWDQITKNGTSSAGSMGVGGTGDSGKLQGDGSRQAAGRTDDLLDDGSEMGEQGYTPGAGQLQTGLEGIGNLTGGAKGSRQSGRQDDQGTSDEGRDQENSAGKGQQNR